MAKSKIYPVDTSNRNNNYIPKENFGYKSKQRKRIYKQWSSYKQSIDETHTDSSIEAKIIGKSTISKLFSDMNNPLKLMSKTNKIDKSQHFLLNMYSTLADNNDEILCKKDAYRRMKSKSSKEHYTIESISNAKQLHLNGISLANHIRAYLCSIIYPPIFEICNKSSFDIIFSEYPMLIECWCNMLEEAILLDGYIHCLHTNIIKLLDPRYDSVSCADNKYDFDYIGEPSNPYKNYKHLLINLYVPSILLTCRIREQSLITNAKENTSDRTIKNIINYCFFQSGNRGITMRSSVKTCINQMFSIYDDYIKYINKLTANDSNQIQTSNTQFLKIFPLYNICLQTHILDFVWHSNFYNVDFHITEGFITNYILNKIMKQNAKVITEIANKYPDDSLRYGKKYTCDESMELSLKSSIERYDLYFLRQLIKQCSNTFQKYDLCFEKKQANSIWNVICNTTSPIVDDFYKNIVQKYLLNNIKHSSKLLETIWDKSKDYYQTIYYDIYNWHI